MVQADGWAMRFMELCMVSELKQPHPINMVKNVLLSTTTLYGKPMTMDFI